MAFLEKPFINGKRAFETYREKGLINSKPCLENPKLRTPEHIKQLVRHVRETYHCTVIHIKAYLSAFLSKFIHKQPFQNK